MKVEIIEEKSRWDLQRRVNEFLKGLSNESIIDIKYSGSGNHPPYSVDYYSVMIILK